MSSLYPAEALKTSGRIGKRGIGEKKGSQYPEETPETVNTNKLRKEEKNMELMSSEMVRKKIMETEQKIEKIEHQIAGLPKGELICAKNDERYKWYLKENGKQKYLPKKKRALAEALAEKKYYIYWLEELKNELDIYKYYLKKYPDNKRTTDSLLLHKGWGELLKNRFIPTKLELQKWQNEEYIS